MGKLRLTPALIASNFFIPISSREFPHLKMARNLHLNAKKLIN